MARLAKGEKESRLRRLFHLLQRHRFGLYEQEIADEMGVHRRTANNYLHELDDQGKAHRQGRKWYPG